MHSCAARSWTFVIALLLAGLVVRALGVEMVDMGYNHAPWG
jgi:hypothetical protein